MSSTRSIADRRREYNGGGLRRRDLAADPFEQFSKWFDEACEGAQNEPNAMTLATASPQGRPTARTVLLKEFDASGFVFFTHYESVKAREIAENPQVALLFPWLEMQRQVSVTGAAGRISSGESLRYFVSRPLGSRFGAWASPQSSVIESRAFLETEYEEIRRRFPDGEVPLPPAWGGYRVVPDALEFWQGRENRLHDRFRYTRDRDGSWRIDRLAP